MWPRSQTNTGTGSTTGVLTFDHGTIDANNLYIGYHLTGLPPRGRRPTRPAR